MALAAAIGFGVALACLVPPIVHLCSGPLGPAIGGYLDMGEFVSMPALGATYGLALLWALVVGTVGAIVFAEMTGRAFPDFHIDKTAPQCIVPGSPARVLAPYRASGTMLGPMDLFAPTGRKMSVAGVDQWTFRGELLRGYYTYYDTLDVTRQLGIMPASGSRAERVMARLQHAQAWVQRRAARAT